MRLDLPAGLRAHVLVDGDVDEVVALVRRCEEHDSGAPMYERADLLSDLAQVDRDRDAVVVRDPTGRIVAWAMVLRARSRWADVAPEARGQGVGSALVAWSVMRARALGADRVGQTVEDVRHDAAALLRRRGAVPVRTSWILRRAVDPADADATVGLPVGLRLADSGPDVQDAALVMMERAFSAWPDRPPSTLATWQAMVTQREGFTDRDLRVVLDPAGTVMGAAFLIDDGSELWVDKLAVHPGHQRLGIGRALLRDAFGRAARSGRVSTALSTDSTTSALPFYESAGMRVERSFTHWAIPLRADLPA